MASAIRGDQRALSLSFHRFPITQRQLILAGKTAPLFAGRSTGKPDAKACSRNLNAFAIVCTGNGESREERRGLFTQLVVIEPNLDGASGSGCVAGAARADGSVGALWFWWMTLTVVDRSVVGTRQSP